MLKPSSVLVLVLMIFTSLVRGADDLRDAQIDAATGNAIEALRADVADEYLSPKVTVQDLLKKTDSAGELMKTLRRAQRIGGPRWIDDQTCQVRLELGGDRVADALVQIAQTHADTSPIPADAIRQKLKDWDDRTFVATGTSAAAEVIGGLKPQGNEAWARVSNEARKAAILSAKQTAAQRAIDGVKPIKLGKTKTVADALANKDVNDAMMAWIQSRPATSVQFRDDLSVDVTLVVPPGEMFDVFRTSMHDKKDVPQPASDEEWARVRKEFVDRAANVTGRGRAVSPSPTQPQLLAVLPDEAPKWINQPLTAEATTSDRSNGGKLRTARAAEDKAIGELRKKIADLPLSSSQTIGGATKQNKALGDAIDQALQRAKPYHVDYRGDGSVSVKVMLDARDLWNALQSGD
jgi:hypothetical protein